MATTIDFDDWVAWRSDFLNSKRCMEEPMGMAFVKDHTLNDDELKYCYVQHTAEQMIQERHVHFSTKKKVH